MIMSIVIGTMITQKHTLRSTQEWSQDVSRQAILKWPNDDKTPTIRDLPRGIRVYMNDHPQDFDNYLKEIKAEQKYLKMIKNNVLNTEIKDRKALWENLIRQTPT
eukprot:TRINITY_DN1405_c0_g1_i7.p1 TRINITY_DN1405_c0_g1~~TRINITY_DN1405_c0_g1_i7.p1  ORF type:complete len:105 (+),score=18.19 TRINITY_DN1405_c0_g1_i7:352-666(+)